MDRKQALFAQMRDEAAHAGSFVAGMSHEEFLVDSKTQHAVSMCRMNIGSLCGRLLDIHPDLPDHYPDTAWHHIRGLRNRIAHKYPHLEFARIRATVQDDVPVLRDQLEMALGDGKEV